MRALAFAWILLLSLLAGSASAAPQQELDERNHDAARRLAAQAPAAFERRDYRRAQSLLEEAYRLYPSPKLQYSLGRVYEMLGRSAAAVTAYQIFLAGVPVGERVPGQAEEVSAALRRLSRRLGRLQVRGPNAAWFQIDGGERQTLPVAELWIEPGSHRVACAGGEMEVDVKAGGQTAIYLLAAPSPPTAPPATSMAAPSRSRPLRALKWAALAAGLAGVVAGGVLIGVHGQPRCDLRSRELQCPELLNSRDAGIGVLSTGGALVIGAGVMFYLDLRSGKVRF